MKKIFFTIAALCAFTATTYAQTPDIKLGAKAGVNLSKLSNKSINNPNFNFPGIAGLSVEPKMRTSFNVGVLAEVYLAEKFSIQPEILYSSQGIKYKTTANVLGYTKATSMEEILDYINIPIIAKYYIFEGFNIQAGPQVGFLVKESFKTSDDKNSTTKETNPTNDKSKSIYNSFDFGVGFGAGYELPSGLFIDARYNMGLTNVYKSNNTDNKHQVIQVSVGFKF